MQDQSNPLVVLTELVDNLRKATSIAEVNVAAGIAYNDLNGLDPED